MFSRSQCFKPEGCWGLGLWNLANILRLFNYLLYDMFLNNLIILPTKYHSGGWKDCPVIHNTCCSCRECRVWLTSWHVDWQSSRTAIWWHQMPLSISVGSSWTESTYWEDMHNIYAHKLITVNHTIMSQYIHIDINHSRIVYYICSIFLWVLITCDKNYPLSDFLVVYLTWLLTPVFHNLCVVTHLRMIKLCQNSQLRSCEYSDFSQYDS